jgi:hypothetical protein
LQRRYPNSDKYFVEFIPPGKTINKKLELLKKEKNNKPGKKGQSSPNTV